MSTLLLYFVLPLRIPSPPIRPQMVPTQMVPTSDSFSRLLNLSLETPSPRRTDDDLGGSSPEPPYTTPTKTLTGVFRPPTLCDDYGPTSRQWSHHVCLVCPFDLCRLGKREGVRKVRERTQGLTTLEVSFGRLFPFHITRLRVGVVGFVSPLFTRTSKDRSSSSVERRVAALC